jgi:hypothetical protein
MNSLYRLIFIYSLAALLGGALFLTSENVQDRQKEYRALVAQNNINRENIRILKAEWTYLNRPDRLEQLANAYLGPVKQQVQVVVNNVHELPSPSAIDERRDLIKAAPVAFVPAPEIKPQTAPKPNRLPAKDTPSFQQLIDRVAAGETVP